MRYVVGYSANARGHDAVNLAVSLALGRGASLDLVLVVPEVQQSGHALAPKAGFENLLTEQAQEWLDQALALVPSSVPAQAHIRSHDSDAHALIEAAEELGADMLIIGATSTGLFKRFTIGSVASALLHASTVPVALAPHGYHRQEALTRISCGLGTRAGAEKLLEFALGMAANRDVPLRVVSLLALERRCGRFSRRGPGVCGQVPCRRTGCRRAGSPGGGEGESGGGQDGSPGRGEDGNRRRPRAQHRGSRGPPGLGRRRGPVDRIQPACQGPVHLPRQHSGPHSARPAGADDRGPQRL